MFNDLIHFSDCQIEFGDNESLQLYVNSQQILDNNKVACSFISESDTMKKFRLETKKAIVTPVNAINQNSGDHLREKYHLLYNMLAGKGSFNASQHPQGLDYCKYILALRFVVSYRRENRRIS